MAYALITAEGENFMGDRELTEYLKEQCDMREGAVIINDVTLEQVYPPLEVEEDAVSSEREETGS